MARPRTFDEAQVLGAITQLFWKKGFADTSISDLEAVSGLKRTSLYAAFGDKQSLYLKALTHYRQQGHQQYSDALADVSCPIQRIQRLFEKTIESAFQDCNPKGCFMNHAATERFGSCPDTTQLVQQNKARLRR